MAHLYFFEDNEGLKILRCASFPSLMERLHLRVTKFRGVVCHDILAKEALDYERVYATQIDFGKYIQEIIMLSEHPMSKRALEAKRDLMLIKILEIGDIPVYALMNLKKAVTKILNEQLVPIPNWF